MAMRRMKKHAGKKAVTKSVSKPTTLFGKSAKKPEADDSPGAMRGKKKHRKLAGMMI